MRRFFILNLFLLALASPQALRAEGYYLRVGPPGVGNGGPNPVGIPPNIYDLELAVVTASQFETTVGIPGLLFGKRDKAAWGGYVALGGGFLFDANGAGPGVYASFGWESSGKIKFNAELKQTLGFGSEGVIAPYAFRLGIAYWR